MPATEQTWRDSKLLHLVFGLTGLAMLVCTIWMLAADHRREWKTYQSTFQGIEAWTAQSRISQQESAQYEQDVADAHAALDKAVQEVPAGTLVDRFNTRVRQQAEELSEKANLKPVDDAYELLSKAPEEERPARRDRLARALNEFVEEARFRENGLASFKKFRSAELDVARSEYELGVGNDLPQSQLNKMQAKVEEIRGRVEASNDKLQNATAYRKDLEEIVGEMFAAQTAAEKQLDDLLVKHEQLEQALYDREHKVMNTIIGLPIIDAFAPKKLDQIWLPKLTINYNFRDVAQLRPLHELPPGHRSHGARLGHRARLSARTARGGHSGHAGGASRSARQEARWRR